MSRFKRGVVKPNRFKRKKVLPFERGTIVKFKNNKIHKHRRYIFINMHTHTGNALLFRKGPTERSQYYVFTDPKKIEKAKVSRRKKESEVSSD